MGCCDVTQCRIFRSGMIHFLSNYCDGLHFLGQTVAVMICCRVDYVDVQLTWITVMEVITSLSVGGGVGLLVSQ